LRHPLIERLSVKLAGIVARGHEFTTNLYRRCVPIVIPPPEHEQKKPKPRLDEQLGFTKPKFTEQALGGFKYFDL
jgi:hypothetical protein